MNIPWETVTVVVETPPDFTGAAFGFLGVILGSLLGLAGIRWQHDAQRAYDVRKLCAGFIRDGELIRDSYIRSTNGMHPDHVITFLQSLREKSDAMIRTQRQLELVATDKITSASHRYWMQCQQIVDYAESRFGLSGTPSGGTLHDANNRWQRSRDALILELRPKANKRSWRTGPIPAWIRKTQTRAQTKKWNRGTHS